MYLRLSFGVFRSLIANDTMNADKLMMKTFYQHLDLQSSGHAAGGASLDFRSRSSSSSALAGCIKPAGFARPSTVLNNGSCIDRLAPGTNFVRILGLLYPAEALKEPPEHTGSTSGNRVVCQIAEVCARRLSTTVKVSI